MPARVHNAGTYTSVNATSVTPPLPSGRNSTRYLVAYCFVAAAGSSIGYPNDWQLVAFNSNGSVNLLVIKRAIDGTETAPLISFFGGTSQLRAQVLQITGIDSAGPIGSANISMGTGTTASDAGFTTGTDHSAALVITGVRSNSSGMTPSGYTVRDAHNDANASTNVSDKEITPAGATGTINATVTSAAWAMATIELVSTGAGTLDITWSRRNRLTEDGVPLEWTEADVSPEAGQTSTVTVYSHTHSVLATHTGISGTTYTLNLADFGAEDYGYVKVTSERDGFDSLQGFEFTVQLNPVTAVALAATGGPNLSAGINQAYDNFTVTASNGVPPYSFALSGTWPAGIYIDGTTNPATIQGTVGIHETPGTFSGLSVTVTDARGDSADIGTFAIEVFAHVPELSFPFAFWNGTDITYEVGTDTPNGTLYFVVLNDTTITTYGSPSGDQIIAGHDANDAAADQVGTIPIVDTLIGPSATGVFAGASYHAVYMVQISAAGAQSNVSAYFVFGH